MTRVWHLVATISALLHYPEYITATSLPSSQCPWNPLGPLRSRTSTSCPLPVNSNSIAVTRDWDPWTYKPFCVYSTTHTNVEFCTYTHIPFRRMHGVSLIVEPHIAATLTSSLPDPDVSWDPQRDPFEAGALHEPPAYVVQDIPGKGKGVVAQRKIRRGEMFMVDFPVLVAGVKFPEVLSVRQGSELIKWAVMQLPRPELVLELGRSVGGGVVEDVLKTNVFALEIEGTPHMALYPEISRINHACKPNAFTRASPRILNTEVVAHRDIELGEEITLTYIPSILPHSERRLKLRAWNFTCACPICSAPASGIAHSDSQRARIQAIGDELAYLRVASPTPENRSQIDTLSKELLRIVEEEELPGELPMFWEQLARVYFDVGDVLQAL
ncbi:SET domain-containing protein, partial [Patellaria atrata CBS 101060]